MPLVRTTMQPYLVQRVDHSEYLDLKRQGLVSEVVPETYPVPVAVSAPVKNKKEGAE
jgi:hypothetical protein